MAYNPKFINKQRDALPGPLRGLINFVMPQDDPLGGLSPMPMAGTVVDDSFFSIMKNFLKGVRESVKKDPVEVFKAERLTGPRVPSPEHIAPPPGFEYPIGFRQTPRRAPEIMEQASIEKKFYDRLSKKPVPTQEDNIRRRIVNRPPAVKGLEELPDITPVPSHSSSRIRATTLQDLHPRSGQKNTRYPKGLADEIVSKAREYGDRAKAVEALKSQYKQVNPNTLAKWIRYKDR